VVRFLILTASHLFLIVLQPLQESRDAGLGYRIVCTQGHEETDPPHPLGLLRPRREPATQLLRRRGG
jgi:hypothetical protein